MGSGQQDDGGWAEVGRDDGGWAEVGRTEVGWTDGEWANGGRHGYPPLSYDVTDAVIC